ncbi:MULTISPECIES: nucleoside kinase [unclassified Fusibacter]|uniref:nucleoside kinase n=1 Tax=unclassified Fusibacter TaxID=2624464 RepID=UPI001011701A|nr:MULTISPECIES: nucleoside kinase [unclassified Fusibacter]MCK8060982.1 nucleoside kinase [Fusibacter sp. A2]NPE20564.1 nucleoside kinase [Fusibacter sp. A1]RXV63761.1 nucleoside kinase [Fusibacter sp. A1]
MSDCFIRIGELFEIESKIGTPLADIARQIQSEHDSQIVAFKVNNHFKELSDTLKECHNYLEIVDMNNPDGIRIYQRSLAFVFIRAVKELYAGATVDIQHSLSKGLFCVVHKSPALCEADMALITEKMKELIALDEPFLKTKITNEEAEVIFREQHMEAKAKLLKYRQTDNINIYSYGWLKDYFYGYMLVSAGGLSAFELTFFDGGIILRHPTAYSGGQVPPFEPQPKLAQIHREAEKWGDILNVGYIYNINELIESDQIREQILITEALHEKKIAEIADHISANDKRLILIAGPSSSGKTTFANRLKIQLRVNGLHPVTMGTDDYFVNREFTPVDENGKYDFEAIEAVDLDQFNKDLAALLDGQEVELPTFNFLLGVREYRGKKMKIGAHQPIIIEGIHGLNPKLTSDISEEDKFRIYISCLTQLNIDNHNRIPTTDSRLFRRIVRDNNYRGHNALTTLKLWASVRRGEERNIFPYQETADVMFNSAMVYELAVLKKHIEPLLLEIPETEPEFAEAKRLLKFLSYVKSIETNDEIPNTSIVREFVGGSVFRE